MRTPKEHTVFLLDLIEEANGGDWESTEGLRGGITTVVPPPVWRHVASYESEAELQALVALHGEVVASNGEAYVRMGRA